MSDSGHGIPNPRRPTHDRNSPERPLSREKVGYWYFRLNGFLQIENFVVHPSRPSDGGQRTDADLIGVRFPHRKERLFDGFLVSDVMDDDNGALRLSPGLIEVVIVEIKAGRCKLNGPWTTEELENIHRVLAAVGCVPEDRIREAAALLYNPGECTVMPGLRVRLMAMGDHRCAALAESHPLVVQLTWLDVLSFMYDRLRKYRNIKRNVQPHQWDGVGHDLRRLADRTWEKDDFVTAVLRRMRLDDELKSQRSAARLPI